GKLDAALRPKNETGELPIRAIEIRPPTTSTAKAPAAVSQINGARRRVGGARFCATWSADGLAFLPRSLSCRRDVLDCLPSTDCTHAAPLSAGCRSGGRELYSTKDIRLQSFFESSWVRPYRA